VQSRWPGGRTRALLLTAAFALLAVAVLALYPRDDRVDRARVGKLLSAPLVVPIADRPAPTAQEHEGPRMTIVVVDPDARGVSDAVATFVPVFPVAAGRADVHADHTGRCSIVVSGECVSRATVRAPGFVDQSLLIGAGRTATVTLQRGCAVHAVLEQWESGAWHAISLVYEGDGVTPRAVPCAASSVELGHVKPGILQLSAEWPSGVRASLQPIAVPAEPELQVVLRPPVRDLRIRALGHQQERIDNWGVIGRFVWGDNNIPLDLTRGPVDAAGYVPVLGVPRAPVSLTLTAVGYAPSIIEPFESSEITVVMQPCSELAVVSRAGGIADVLVYLIADERNGIRRDVRLRIPEATPPGVVSMWDGFPGSLPASRILSLHAERTESEWVFHGVPDNVLIAAVATHTSGVRAIAYVDTAAQREAVEVRWPEVRTVAVMVTRAERAVPKALVSVLERRGGVGGVVAKSWTDADGRSVFCGFDEKLSYAVTVQHDARVATYEVTEESLRQGCLDVPWPDAPIVDVRDVSVHVADTRGAPIGGAIVQWRALSATPAYSVTDDRGIAQSRVGNKEPYGVWVSKPGYRVVVSATDLADKTKIELEQDAQLRVEVTVASGSQTLQIWVLYPEKKKNAAGANSLGPADGQALTTPRDKARERLATALSFRVIGRSGVVETNELGAGDYYVQVRDEGGAVLCDEVRVSLVEGSVTTVPISVG